MIECDEIMGSKFIVVNDPDVIDTMIASGFKMFYKEKNMAIFINDVEKKINFSNIDKGKLIYTNKIFI